MANTNQLQTRSLGKNHRATMALMIMALAAITAAAVTLLTAYRAWAAPMPGTSTSKLVEPQLGLYRSPLGFQISAAGTDWQQSEPPKDNKFIATLYRGPARPKAKDRPSLTVRVDKIERDLPLNKYVTRWQKEYPKYGFDVLGSQQFTQGKDKGYVLDLLNRDNKKQIRQVVFLKKQKAVIITCRDASTTFKESLKACNQIIKSFQWVE